jgi:hypothetical protein
MAISFSSVWTSLPSSQTVALFWRQARATWVQLPVLMGVWMSMSSFQRWRVLALISRLNESFWKKIAGLRDMSSLALCRMLRRTVLSSVSLGRIQNM